MTFVASLCAALVAAVLASAAGAKLADQPGTARSFRALGLTNTYTLARAVPISEAAIAVSLLLVPGVGAAAAVVLLAVFSVFLAGRIRAGVTAPCSCFGSVGEDPLSPRHLVRNAALALAAIVVVVVFGLQLAPWQLGALASGPVAAALVGAWRRARHPG